MKCEFCATPIRSGNTCRLHSPRFRGKGRLRCRVCGEPQRNHEVGYWEHDVIAHQSKTPKGWISATR